jgi:hypothetical protein
MWDTIRLSAVGKFFFNKIAVVILAVMMSALFVATANTPISYAADATWSGDTITYNGDTYNKQALTLPGTDSTSQIFVSTPANVDPNTQTKTAKVITIPGNADSTKDISNAQETDYTVDANGNYTNPTSPHTVSVGAQTNTGQTGSSNQNKTSCAVTGVGWIVCATSRFMAESMDKVYSWISDFLKVKPLTTDTSSPLFQTWSIVKGLANACFIVAFLIIIYSQITSYGISNYEIKKMIPKLIVAAILVNVSYYICAAGVDLSNIMGDSIAKALSQVRDSLPAPMPQGDFFNTGGWASITTFILSGGTLGAAGGIAALTSATAGGSIAALATLLFPVLVMAVLSTLVALLVLAARQALITVLVVLSPLAFVMYLLPNTEKQFGKWRELFVTMLMVFPMFSLLFGGAQLASYLIIQNTTQPQVVILALFVQAAPLAVTPFLIRFSGSLLGKLGGMVNNPQKGLVDRSRNWAKDRADTLAKRKMAAAERKPQFRTASGFAYRRNMNKRNRESQKKLYESQLDAAWSGDSRSIANQRDTKAAELRQNANKATAERVYEHYKETTPALMALEGQKRLEEARVKQMHSAEEARWEEAKSERVTADNVFAPVATAARAVLEAQQVADGSKEAAMTMQTKEYVERLKSDVNLQMSVGGIDPNGALKALAKAKSASYAAKAEVIKQIEDASDIMPGKTIEMASALETAINTRNVEEVRAYTNMLAKSNDPGVSTLREILKRREADIDRGGMLEELKFHINGHQTLNTDAEDMVRWSRDDRSLREVSSDAGVYLSLSAQKFMGQKRSTQEGALDVGGVARSTMRDILKNPGKANVKEPVLRRLRREMGVAEDGTEDDTL